MRQDLTVSNYNDIIKCVINMNIGSKNTKWVYSESIWNTCTDCTWKGKLKFK